jgi:3-hydroxyisobutyrate dehydrogenase-like beta-hydroxyacid dehydrogenase
VRLRCRRRGEALRPPAPPLPQRAEGLVERVALLGEGVLHFAATAREAVAGDGAVVVCLFDHGSVRGVLDPLAAGLSGRTLINLTTTTPDESRALAAWAAPELRATR